MKNFRRAEIKGNAMVAGAGCLNTSAIKTAGAQGLSGLEFAVGIPGTVGGLVVMNGNFNADNLGEKIEAAGLKDVNLTTGNLLTTVTALDENGKIVALGKDRLALGYRDSIFQHKEWIALGATFDLQKRSVADVRKLISIMMEARDEKESRNVRSLGCVFSPRNASYVFEGKQYTAGWFAGQVNAAQMQDGDIQVDPVLPNHIVNVRDGTAEQFISVVQRIHDEVLDKFGVRLELEVKSFPPDLARNALRHNRSVRNWFQA